VNPSRTTAPPRFQPSPRASPSWAPVAVEPAPLGVAVNEDNSPRGGRNIPAAVPHHSRSEVSMPRVSKQRDAASPPDSHKGRRIVPAAQIMLTPQTAWRALCRRTGAGISRATFYRWVNSGKLYSVRLGFQIFIPQIALEDLVKQCLDGERF
jgi:hypothetical protein